jgi:hypothetical protein
MVSIRAGGPSDMRFTERDQPGLKRGNDINCQQQFEPHSTQPGGQDCGMISLMKIHEGSPMARKMEIGIKYIDPSLLCRALFYLFAATLLPVRSSFATSCTGFPLLLTSSAPSEL